MILRSPCQRRGLQSPSCLERLGGSRTQPWGTEEKGPAGQSNITSPVFVHCVVWPCPWAFYCHPRLTPA